MINVATAVDFPPFGRIDTDFEVPGKAHTETWKGQMGFCDPQFFPTIGMRLLRGRLLTDADITGKLKVAVANQQLANKFFPGEDPVGKSIKLLELEKAPEPISNPTFEIVGVVSDIKNHGLREAAAANIRPLDACLLRHIHRVYPHRDQSDQLNESARWSRTRHGSQCLARADEHCRRVAERIRTRTAAFRFADGTAFAVIGLLLVSVGIYSVVSYTVSQQTRETGVRMALGGTRPHVRNWVLASGMRYIAIGIACGSAIAFALLRLLRSEIWGIKHSDPATLGIVIVLFAFVGFLACCVPALRATRVDPVIALRQE